MKKTQKISIIGAGIMGIMSAYTLQNIFPEAIIKLYDREGFPANNASFTAGGMISPLSELDHIPHSHLSAGYASIELWHDISKNLKDTFEFNKNGSLLLAHEQDKHILERFKSMLPDNHNNWKIIDQHSLHEIEPFLKNTSFRQGVYIKEEAHLHPQKAMKALLHKIKNTDHCKIDPKEEAEKTDWVIDCRGIGTQSEQPDLRGVKGEILVVRNKEFKLSRPLRLMHPRYPLYIVPRANNIFMIGATIIESNKGDYVTIRSGMELMSALYSLHRSFGDAEIIEIKSGIRPAYEDNLPRITIDNNIICANGLYRHGYLFAPVIAQTIAHHIAGKNYEHQHLFLKENKHENHFERRIAND